MSYKQAMKHWHNHHRQKHYQPIVLGLFNPTFTEEYYELTRKMGDVRFGPECIHETVHNGICQNCLRKVK